MLTRGVLGRKKLCLDEDAAGVSGFPDGAESETGAGCGVAAGVVRR